jgi:hypothetical protein
MKIKSVMPPRLFLLSSLCASALLSASCAGKHHKIILRDGREFYTAGTPRYVEKTGYYRYRALNGKDALVRADEVLFIREE